MMPTKKPFFSSPTKGPTTSSPIGCPETCPAVYEPVCGSDFKTQLKTYGNICELEREACTKKIEIKKFHDGDAVMHCLQ